MHLLFCLCIFRWGIEVECVPVPTAVSKFIIRMPSQNSVQWRRAEFEAHWVRWSRSSNKANKVILLLKCGIQWCHLHQSFSFLNKQFIDKQNYESIDHFSDAKKKKRFLHFAIFSAFGSVQKEARKRRTSFSWFAIQIYVRINTALFWTSQFISCCVNNISCGIWYWSTKGS